MQASGFFYKVLNIRHFSEVSRICTQADDYKFCTDMHKNADICSTKYARKINRYWILKYINYVQMCIYLHECAAQYAWNINYLNLLWLILILASTLSIVKQNFVTQLGEPQNVWASLVDINMTVGNLQPPIIIKYA